MSSKRLYILRHAQALPAVSGDDKGRKLSPKGLDDAAALGKTMLRHDYKPQHILCSPAQRTKETWDCILQGLNDPAYDPDYSYPDRLYNAMTGDLMKFIQDTEDGVSSLMIVAHNPGVAELVRFLCADSNDSRLYDNLINGYQPATLSVIDMDAQSWSEIQPAINAVHDILSPLDYNADQRPTRWM